MEQPDIPPPDSPTPPAAAAPPPPQPPGRARDVVPRALVVLVGLAAAFLVISGMRSASGLIGSAFLALVLTIAVHPLRVRLERWMPSWVSATLCVLLVTGLVLGLAFALVVATARFAGLLPRYRDEFHDLLRSGEAALHRLGVSGDQFDRLLDGLDLGKVAGLVTDALSGALSGAYGVVTSVIFMLTLVLFMVLDGRSFPGHLAVVRRSRPDLADALTGFASGTRQYLLVSTVFGFVVAALDTVALELMGIPAPLVWGLLAFLTNYIPNIGFVIGLVPPAVLGLLEGGPWLMVAVVVVYSVLNFVIQSVIQPKIVGDTVGLSATLTFLSVLFWSWVVGPLGAILAVPLSLLARSVLVDADPASRWLVPLISGSPAPEPARPPDAEAT
ncbi:AI-2E family transporter [Nocardioides campestrisoli]|uniref:AI-2E family transporter n=1 Tax=Nocardioides campestrisoli TaxID=2736757 RepID=UPI0015E7DE4B|nr:AI-2E family transporter [Nocardioides campestrisoli]